MSAPAPEPANHQQEALDRLHRRLSPSGQRGQTLRMAVRTWGFRWAFFLVSGLKRAMDLALAGLLMILTSPVFAVAILWSVVTRTPVFHTNLMMGRWCVPFLRLSFSHQQIWGKVLRAVGLSDLPVLINVLKGDMSFVGPLARPYRLEDAREALFRARQIARPGLLSLWWLRRQTNIDFEHEYEIDVEYVLERGFGADTGILLRALPAALLGQRVSNDALVPKVNLLGIPLDNVTMAESIADLLAFMEQPRPHLVSFVNAACMNIAHDEPPYRQALLSSDRILADGIGVKLAGSWLGTPLRQNVNGTDLFPRLLTSMAQKNVSQGKALSLFLLGGQPGIAERVASFVREFAPGVVVAGTRHGYFEESEVPAICEEIRASGANLLLVAMGVPRQELFLYQNLDALGVPVSLGVGGLFDFYSGNIPRAPQWVRDIGMEWSWRLLQEPQRMWRRYLLGNGVFLLRVGRAWWAKRLTGRPASTGTSSPQETGHA